jgi:hypothetical protein
MNDTKFIYCAGAPGSMWSRITNRIKRNCDWIDRSDDTVDRRYQLPPGVIESRYTAPGERLSTQGHYGSYFGPGNEFGQNFDDLTNYDYNVEDFKRECLMPFVDDSKTTKLIRCHWFAYNLEWLKQNCKGDEILLVWRGAEQSRDWWYGMGGWDINHPDYSWYQNDERMWQKMQEETDCIKQFGDKYNVNWVEYDTEDDWVLKLYPNITSKVPNFGQFFLTDSVKVALYKID